MKKLLFCIFFAAIISNIAMSQNTGKELKHVVLFGWKAGTDSAAIQQIIERFKKLPTEINTVKAFEWGTNNSPENLNQGLTHCFILTFSSEKDRDDYLVHPAHKAFVSALKPAPEKVTVFDYWVQE